MFVSILYFANKFIAHTLFSIDVDLLRFWLSVLEFKLEINLRKKFLQPFFRLTVVYGEQCQSDRTMSHWVNMFWRNEHQKEIWIIYSDDNEWCLQEKIQLFTCWSENQQINKKMPPHSYAFSETWMILDHIIASRRFDAQFPTINELNMFVMNFNFIASFTEHSTAIQYSEIWLLTYWTLQILSVKPKWFRNVWRLNSAVFRWNSWNIAVPFQLIPLECYMFIHNFQKIKWSLPSHFLTHY